MSDAHSRHALLLSIQYDSSVPFATICLTFFASIHAFTNPLNEAYGADPCLRYLNGTYYLSATQNTDISMWAADTLEGLKTATRQVLFTDTTAGRDFDLWAPEFWYLDGRWYIYYAAAGNGDDGTHRLHVLAGGTDASDPTNGEYSYAAALIPSNFDKWAVDGSILEVEGARYLIYSGKTEDEIWTQCTYAVELDSPTALSGEATQISCPTYDWTPCWPLVGPSNPRPVFTKNVDAGVYGPGHHFMFEKDGEHLFAYHGKSEPGQGCGELRTTRVQPFSVEGGVPVFPVAVGVGIEISEP